MPLEIKLVSIRRMGDKCALLNESISHSDSPAHQGAVCLYHMTMQSSVGCAGGIARNVAPAAKSTLHVCSGEGISTRTRPSCRFSDDPHKGRARLIGPGPALATEYAQFQPIYENIRDNEGMNGASAA